MAVWYAGWNENSWNMLKSHSTLHIRHSHRITRTKCRMNTVVSPDDGHICRPKHVEIDKYTKNKLCTKLALFTRYLFGWVHYLARYPNTYWFQDNTCKVRISQPRCWGFRSSGIWRLMMDWLILQKMGALCSSDTSNTTHITLFNGSRPQFNP